MGKTVGIAARTRHVRRSKNRLGEANRRYGLPLFRRHGYKEVRGKTYLMG